MLNSKTGSLEDDEDEFPFHRSFSGLYSGHQSTVRYQRTTALDRLPVRPPIMDPMDNDRVQPRLKWPGSEML